MDNDLTILEKVLLMGLLPLLGGTTNLYQSLIIALSAIIISIIIKYIADTFTFEYDYKWYILFGLGITLSYIFYITIINVFPFFEVYTNIYLLLLGVTPLIYIGASSTEHHFFDYQKDFFILMIMVGAFREILGLGTILGIQLTKPGYPPFGFVKDFPGAFLIVSVIYLIVEVTRRNKIKNNKQDEGSEKIV